MVEDLGRAIRDLPKGPIELAPTMSAQGPELSAALSKIMAGQDAIQEMLSKRDLPKATEQQADLDAVVDDALRAWPLDPVLVNLAGYHLKNAYMLMYWDAIQAGRGPRDPLLERSERRFLETLALDPTDPSSLNGLGNILFFRRDLDAAEFFHLAALAAAKQQGIAYPAAGHDLELVRQYKRS